MRREAQPHVRAARIFLILLAFSAGLVLYYGRVSARDIETASGPVCPRQRAFFQDASERPDALALFERMTPAQRLQTARNLAAYHEPKIAKLAVVLLESFDATVRKTLAASLSNMAKFRPSDVAEQLNKNSSFQVEGVFFALRSAGSVAIPAVARQLKSGEHRANAVSLLVQLGPSAARAARDVLKGSDSDASLAAAEALGKLRSQEATPDLIDRFKHAKGDARFDYLAAVCGIGDPRTEDLLLSSVNDESLPFRARQQAALGLGRIGSPRGVALLYRLTQALDSALADAAWDGLKEAGNAALAETLASLEKRLRVAAGVATPKADAVLISGLQSGSRPLVKSALEGAVGHTGLTKAVLAALIRCQPDADGDLIERATAALASTPEGAKALKKVSKSPHYGGFALRDASRGRP